MVESRATLCRTISLILAQTFIVSCGMEAAPQNVTKPDIKALLISDEKETGDSESFALADASSAWCPQGSTLNTTHWLCIDGIHAIGPFSPAMIDACVREGGGQQACNSDRWDAAFAKRIRGTSACPPGTSLDAGLGECLQGDNIYGPFSRDLVERCLAATNSSPVCKTQRIHRSFALAGQPRTPNRTTPSSPTSPLRVPYFYQYNNQLEPGSTCNITSVAMVAQYYGVSVTPDQIYRRIGGPVFTGPDMLWAARQYGLQGSYSQTASAQTIKGHIDAGRPVIVQGYFTKSGHILVITGYDKQGWVVNDPAGLWAQCYACGYPSRTASNGKGARYSYAAMERAATDPGNPSSYWITVLTR